MIRKFSILMLVLLFGFLAACGNKEKNEADTDELYMLEVDLEVSEEVEVNDRVDMKATVTYGPEDVTDADEVVFEVWEEGAKEESVMIDSTNHEDGTYAAKTKFDHDGLFHVQVHVTARDLHTMPKKTVTVGDGGEYAEEHEHGEHGDHFHTEGFGMHFMEPEAVKVDESVDLTTHIQIKDEPLEKLNVRYEIWNDEEHGEQHAWVDASETNAGEYTASHTFDKAGTYQVQIHVQDDGELHEHVEYEIEVSE